VEARLLLGDTGGALEKFRVLANDYVGAFDRLLLEHDSVFDPIRNEPVFVALLEKLRTNAAEQQQVLLAMNNAR
jgi:hypothetical protein